MSTGTLAAAAVLAALVLAPAPAAAGVRPAYGGTVRIGVAAPPSVVPGAPSCALSLIHI